MTWKNNEDAGDLSLMGAADASEALNEEREAERVVDAPVIFNGTYTVQNRETGEHRTFSIKTQKEDARFAPGERVLALLSGPDNHADYTGFAFVKEDGRIIVWRSKRVVDGGKPSSYALFARLLYALLVEENEAALARYEVMAESRCLRCNRKLTHPESLKTGLGPECGGRI